MLRVVPALCFEDVLGILTGGRFLVLGPEFGWRNSQWSCFGDNSYCFTTPPKLALVLAFTLCFAFPRDFLGMWEAQCLGRDQKPWGEAVSQPLLCRARFFLGSGSQCDMGSSGMWQGCAGSYQLWPDPLAVILFLQPCWAELPPELLTELCWESLGVTPLVSLLFPEPSALGTRQEGGTQPTCVKSYKGGNWPRSLQTMGLVLEFWLLLRGYLYVGFLL